MFKNFCIHELRGVWIAIGGYNETTFIDSESAESLLHYCDYVLGLKHDEKTILKLTEVLCDLENLTEPSNLDRLLSNEMGDFFNEFV